MPSVISDVIREWTGKYKTPDDDSVTAAFRMTASQGKAVREAFFNWMHQTRPHLNGWLIGLCQNSSKKDEVDLIDLRTASRQATHGALLFSNDELMCYFVLFCLESKLLTPALDPAFYGAGVFNVSARGEEVVRLFTTINQEVSPLGHVTLPARAVLPSQTVRQKVAPFLGPEMHQFYTTHASTAWNDELYVEAISKMEAAQTQMTAFTPNMPSVTEVEQKAKVTAASATATAAAAQLPSPHRLYCLQGIDALAVGSFGCLRGAVVQVAGQANGNESMVPAPTHPMSYPDDRTQGPRSQMMDPIAALARYQKIDACNFISAWQTQPSFQQIFNYQAGYLHPKPGQEEAAVAFFRQHISQLRVNVERINYGMTDIELIQVGTFALALGRYDNAEFNDEADETEQYVRSPQGKTALKEASRLLLTAEYVLAAEVAIIEAAKHPGKRVPLVLTLVGGGVFGNSLERSVYPAVAAALERVQSSGLNNVDVCVSAYAQTEVAAFVAWMQTASQGRIGNIPVLTAQDLQRHPSLADAAQSVTSAQQLPVTGGPAFFQPAPVRPLTPFLSLFISEARFGVGLNVEQNQYGEQHLVLIFWDEIDAKRYAEQLNNFSVSYGHEIRHAPSGEYTYHLLLTAATVQYLYSRQGLPDDISGRLADIVTQYYQQPPAMPSM